MQRDKSEIKLNFKVLDVMTTTLKRRGTIWRVISTPISRKCYDGKKFHSVILEEKFSKAVS